MIEGYSSLPPNPPPVSAWTTRACVVGQAERASAPCARSTGTGASRDGHRRRPRRGPRSSRCSRCRAAPGGRPGTRPRGPASAAAKPASRSPLRDLVAREDVVRDLGVEDRRERLGHEPDAALAAAQGRLAIRRRDAARGARRDAGSRRRPGRGPAGRSLIDADDVLAGDVGGGHDHDLRPVECPGRARSREGARAARSSGWSRRTRRPGRRGRRCTWRRRSACRGPRGDGGSRPRDRRSWCLVRSRVHRERSEPAIRLGAASYGSSSNDGFLRQRTAPSEARAYHQGQRPRPTVIPHVDGQPSPAPGGQIQTTTRICWTTRNVNGPTR